uniref:Uncharacterized protein n=1 Tax=viral metagenome TaxID=1070528 RepID=A0A6H1ZZT0_9ZZZZ
MNSPSVMVTLRISNGKKEISFGKKILFTEETFTKDKIADVINHIGSVILFQTSQKELIDKDNLNIPDNLLEQIYSKLDVKR